MKLSFFHTVNFQSKLASGKINVWCLFSLFSHHFNCRFYFRALCKAIYQVICMYLIDFWFYSRTCNACQATFPTLQGLKLHANSSGSASACRRYEQQSTKASEIRSAMKRKLASKEQKASDVDLTTWNGAIGKGTHYCELAKKLCLNLITVSII